MTTYIKHFDNDESKPILLAYKPNVALISFAGDYGYELTEEEKLNLIDTLEQSTSVEQILQTLHGYRYYTKNNYVYNIISDNSYLCFKIERR